MKHKYTTPLIVYIYLLTTICYSQKDTRSIINQTSPYFGPTKTIVSLDPSTNIAETALPYDRWFYIRAYTQRSGDKLSLAGATLLNAYLVDIIDKEEYLKKQRSIAMLNDNTLKNVYIPIQTKVNSIPKSDKDGYDAFDILVQPIPPNIKRTFDLGLLFRSKNEYLTKYANAFISYYKDKDNDKIEALTKSISDEKLSHNDTETINPLELMAYLGLSHKNGK